MTIGRAMLGVVLIMIGVIISIPISGGLRKLGLPINP